MKKNKGFTLIELLTVIAILAVILLIAAPTILGVLDKARKNTFKNQVLLYVEGLKQQTSLAMMGSGYSELQSIDTSFYAPTNDSNGKLVRVSIDKLNQIMDNQVLAGDNDKYLYVEWSNDGYNYYIGEGVRTDGGYRTTCAYATDNEECDTKTYGSESVKLINSKVFGLIHITRNDLIESNSIEPNPNNTLSAPTIDIPNKTLIIDDGITEYCITTTNNSGSCQFEDTNNEPTIPLDDLDPGTYYIFVKDDDDDISEGTEYTVPIEGDNNTSISLGGYNWHIYGQDDTKIWLLMDEGQLSNMKQCNSGSSSNCPWNGSNFVYSWDVSLVNDYLNTTFYNSLPDFVKNKIVKQQVCKDKAIYSGTNYSYGGFLKSEIDSISGASCGDGSDNAYTLDNVRLLTLSEYHNLSPKISTTTSEYPIASIGDNGKGVIPRVGYITRITSDDWYCESPTSWYWLTTASSGLVQSSVQRARRSNMGEAGGDSNGGVRPVIVLQK